MLTWLVYYFAIEEKQKAGRGKSYGVPTGCLTSAVGCTPGDCSRLLLVARKSTVNYVVRQLGII